MSEIDKFALRRLYYSGRLRRRDLINAFDLSDRTAQRRMRAFASKFSFLMDPTSDKVLHCRDAMRVTRSYLEQHDPEVASCVRGNAVLEEFWKPRTNPLAVGIDATDAKRGFRDETLHYMVDHLGSNQLPQEVDFTELVRALVEGWAVQVRYVSMRRNGSTQTRVLFPQILRVIGDQITVTAYEEKDLLASADQPPLKSFVLFRMLEVTRVRQTEQRMALAQRVENFSFGREDIRRYKVTLNPKFSADQKLVVSRELGLDSEGCKPMDSALRFSFQQQYMADRSEIASEQRDHIWPIVTGLEEA